MHDLEAIINEGKDAREVKRAVSVKMSVQGFSPVQISQVLTVSPQYVSKWKGVYETGGGAALRLGYRGSESYLPEAQRRAILQWIATRATLSVEALRDYIEEQYGVVYRSKQSYYDLLDAGGMSYHRSEKDNPKRDEAQVLARREEIKKNWRRGGPRSSGAS
jgi:putative transposase